MPQIIESTRSVTIRIDETIHNGMKTRARQQRLHLSLLYEQAAEAFLNGQNNLKKDVKKANALPVQSR